MIIFLSILMYIIFPILSLPLVVIGIKKKPKYMKIFLLLIAAVLALVSYSYEPTEIEDLYRHHIDTEYYGNMSMDGLAEKVHNSSEKLNIIYKYVIGKTGNKNLLQFFTAIICFYILLYLLYDNSIRGPTDIEKWKMIGLWIFVLSGFHFLLITSGIFYTLSLEIFSLAVYIDYEKKKKISYLLYIIPIFIHTCAIMPLIVMILYKLFKSKITKKSIIIIVATVLSISIFLQAASNMVNIPIINELLSLYNVYFNNEAIWSDMHTIPVLILYFTRLVPVIPGFAIRDLRKDMSGFALFIVLLVIALFPQTSFSIRYIHIAVLCGIPIMIRALHNKKISAYYAFVLYLVSAPHLYYQLRQISGLGHFPFLRDNLTTDIITTFFGGR